MIGASGSQAADRRHRPVEREIAVDLVGEERDVVRVGDVDERAAHRRRIDRARGVVRIDDDQRARRAA